MSDAPKLPKGLPVELFDPGDLVYTAEDMEDFRAKGERAARAAALDDVVAGIRALQSSYDARYGRPNVAGSACSDCIGAVNALRARAEGDGEGGR